MVETIVKQRNRDPLGALRQERDRFVALAFSSADILMELGPQGAIVFATGSTEALPGRPSFDIGDFETPRGGGLGRKRSGVG